MRKKTWATGPPKFGGNQVTHQATGKRHVAEKKNVVKFSKIGINSNGKGANGSPTANLEDEVKLEHLGILLQLISEQRRDLEQHGEVPFVNALLT